MRGIFIVLALSVFGLGACGHDNGSHHGPTGDGGAGGEGGGDGGSGDDGGGGSGLLRITPDRSTLKVVVGQPLPSLQFTAALDGQTVPATWVVDRGETGAIDGNGLFKASGNYGGKVIVSAANGKYTAATTLYLSIQWAQVGDPAYPAGPAGPGGYGGVGGDGPAPPANAGDQTALIATPGADAAVQLLYPYDGTKLARGILAPLLQWSAGTHTFTSAFVHITQSHFDYKGFFHANSGHFNNLPIPQAVWKSITASNEGDAMVVTLVLGEAGKAWGPLTRHLTVAPSVLKGTVYYNAYGTHLGTNYYNEALCVGLDNMGNCITTPATFMGGATLAIKPGRTDPTLVAGLDTGPTKTMANQDNHGCRTCHSVAANGSTLFTQHGDNYNVSSWYDLSNGNSEHAVASSDASKHAYAFPAVYPDGSLFFSGSMGQGAGMPASGWQDDISQLYTRDGTPVATQGLPAGLEAHNPVFSPDGKHVAFNFWGGTIGSATGDQRSLAIMDFDVATKTFSNARVVYTPAMGYRALWPSFLPTNDRVVFSVATANYSAGMSDLWLYSLTQNQTIRLDKLNGAGYLPSVAMSGHDQDAQRNYQATVAPIVTSGGFAWVVVTSRRLYGTVATAPPTASDPRNYPWQQEITPKKLWVAAIDLNAPAGIDPSLPAFYLPAQELYAGNSRGFWVLDPCQKDGATCESGDECCGGYCRAVSAGSSMLVCTSQKPACAAEYEHCTQTSDCCGAASGTIRCINNFCVNSTPPIP